jgi:hypothetical protein
LLQVQQAVYHLDLSLHARKHARQWQEAVRHAHLSLALSGKAHWSTFVVMICHHLSRLEQAYQNADLYALNLFPEDQKFAIYLPFFAPTCLSLLKILKEHFRR